MTMADLRVNVERNWFIQEVQQRELMRNMTLTEEEARQYYNAHPDEFMKPATVTLREIIVTVPNQTVAGQVSFNVTPMKPPRQKIEALRAARVERRGLRQAGDGGVRVDDQGDRRHDRSGQYG